jgi:hypothetical protein
MASKTRCWRVGVLVVGAIMMAFAGSNTAQEKKAYEKHDTTALYSSLRDVINNGAKIFNEGDHAGCYRMFQGSLQTVRPFMAPGLQKKIDEGLGQADEMRTFAEKAYKLRSILDEVRTQMKPASAEDKKTEEKKKKIEDKKTEDKKPDDKKKIEDKKTEDKKKVEKKTEDKKTEDKKKVEKKTEDKKVEEKKKTTEDKKTDSGKSGKGKGEIAGKITLQGETIAGGYFVTLAGADGKKYSCAIQKDGSFQFTTLIPTGDYRIAIEPITGDVRKGPAVPARYQGEATSGLTVRVQAGGQQFLDMNLLK